MPYHILICYHRSPLISYLWRPLICFLFKKKSYFFLFEEQIALKERQKVCICWFTLPNDCNGKTWATPKLGSRSFSWVSSMCSAQRLEPSATPNPQAESWSRKGAAWTWNGACTGCWCHRAKYELPKEPCWPLSHIVYSNSFLLLSYGCVGMCF